MLCQLSRYLDKVYLIRWLSSYFNWQLDELEDFHFFFNVNRNFFLNINGNLFLNVNRHLFDNYFWFTVFFRTDCLSGRLNFLDDHNLLDNFDRYLHHLSGYDLLDDFNFPDYLLNNFNFSDHLNWYFYKLPLHHDDFFNYFHLLDDWNLSDNFFDNFYRDFYHLFLNHYPWNWFNLALPNSQLFFRNHHLYWYFDQLYFHLLHHILFYYLYLFDNLDLLYHFNFFNHFNLSYDFYLSYDFDLLYGFDFFDDLPNNLHRYFNNSH